MRWLIILVILGSGFVFFLQNQQPMTLFLLGNGVKTALLTLTFPVGLWVILFIFAGMITSLILQALSAIARPVISTAPPSPTRPRSRPTPSPRSPSPEPPPVTEAKTRIQTPTNPQWQWEDPIPEIDDWNDEPSPAETTSSKSVIDLAGHPESVEFPRRVTVEVPLEPPLVSRPPAYFVEDSQPEPRLKEEDLKRFEVNQEPKTSSQQGTIYSYTYREQGDRNPEKQTPKPPVSNQVRDANYRVINPPLRSVQPVNLEDDEDDWL